MYLPSAFHYLKETRRIVNVQFGKENSGKTMERYRGLTLQNQHRQGASTADQAQEKERSKIIYKGPKFYPALSLVLLGQVFLSFKKIYVQEGF